MQSHISNTCTDGQSNMYVARPKTKTKFVSFYFVYNYTSLETIQSQMHTHTGMEMSKWEDVWQLQAGLEGFNVEGKKKSNFANLLLHRRCRASSCWRLQTEWAPSKLQIICSNILSATNTPTPHRTAKNEHSLLAGWKNWVKKGFFTDNLLVCSHNIKAYSHGFILYSFLKEIIGTVACTHALIEAICYDFMMSYYKKVWIPHVKLDHI